MNSTGPSIQRDCATYSHATSMRGKKGITTTRRHWKHKRLETVRQRPVGSVLQERALLRLSLREQNAVWHTGVAPHRTALIVNRWKPGRTQGQTHFYGVDPIVCRGVWENGVVKRFLCTFCSWILGRVWVEFEAADNKLGRWTSIVNESNIRKRRLHFRDWSLNLIWVILAWGYCRTLHK